MTSVRALREFLLKQPEDPKSDSEAFNFEDFIDDSQSPTTGTETAYLGGDAIPRENRLYVSSFSNKLRPEDIGLVVYEGRRRGQFIDKTLLHARVDGLVNKLNAFTGTTMDELDELIKLDPAFENLFAKARTQESGEETSPKVEDAVAQVKALLESVVSDSKASSSSSQKATNTVMPPLKLKVGNTAGNIKRAAKEQFNKLFTAIRDEGLEKGIESLLDSPELRRVMRTVLNSHNYSSVKGGKHYVGHGGAPDDVYAETAQFVNIGNTLYGTATASDNYLVNKSMAMNIDPWIRENMINKHIPILPGEQFKHIIGCKKHGSYDVKSTDSDNFISAFYQAGAYSENEHEFMYMGIFVEPLYDTNGKSFFSSALDWNNINSAFEFDRDKIDDARKEDKPFIITTLNGAKLDLTDNKTRIDVPDYSIDPVYNADTGEVTPGTISVKLADYLEQASAKNAERLSLAGVHIGLDENEQINDAEVSSHFYMKEDPKLTPDELRYGASPEAVAHDVSIFAHLINKRDTNVPSHKDPAFAPDKIEETLATAKKELGNMSYDERVKLGYEYLVNNPNLNTTSKIMKTLDPDKSHFAFNRNMTQEGITMNQINSLLTKADGSTETLMQNGRLSKPITDMTDEEKTKLKQDFYESITDRLKKENVDEALPPRKGMSNTLWADKNKYTAKMVEILTNNFMDSLDKSTTDFTAHVTSPVFSKYLIEGSQGVGNGSTWGYKDKLNLVNATEVSIDDIIAHHAFIAQDSNMGSNNSYPLNSPKHPLARKTDKPFYPGGNGAQFTGEGGSIIKRQKDALLLLVNPDIVNSDIFEQKDTAYSPTILTGANQTSTNPDLNKSVNYNSIEGESISPPVMPIYVENASGELTETSGASTGTTGGKWITTNKGQKLFLKNIKGTKNLYEHLANQIAAKALENTSVKIPKTDLVNHKGENYMSVEEIPNGSHITTKNPDNIPQQFRDNEILQSSVFVPMLLENWDFIGNGPEHPQGNIVHDATTDTYHFIDMGGSFFYGGLSEHKTTGPYANVNHEDIRESINAFGNNSGKDILDGFSKKNVPASQLLKNMSLDTIQKNIDGLNNLTDSMLGDIISSATYIEDESEHGQIYAALIKRKKSLIEAFEQMLEHGEQF